MVKNIIFFLMLVLAMACSVTTNLSKKYEGKGVELLYRDFGEPKETLKLENGNRLFIYEKETFIRQTEIGTGRGTLDPRISPSFIKVELSKFEVDSKGVVVKTGYEKRIDQ